MKCTEDYCGGRIKIDSSKFNHNLNRQDQWGYCRKCGCGYRLQTKIVKKLKRKQKNKNPI